MGASKASVRFSDHNGCGVSLLEFGTPEAMWHLQLRDFPAIVTMDAHGNSLHQDLEQESAKRLAELATPALPAVAEEA